MNDVKTKQQIADKIKSATNILVTVSNDPSVDSLSAALGLTILLNNLEKHATAVFSGAIPPAITFLEPDKTFESTTDSLRDFIIALDKEKADHLRYKVEGDSVKIFITPYRTTITSEDLDFSQGDYNVELVLALGVSDQDHLDGALSAHGRILHDAAVITITAGTQNSNLGTIDWHDDSASSLSEMIVSLSDSIKGDKPNLDKQTATAFLTGIVAATDRFSNLRTSSAVMTTAAKLMAAGADQQLIAAKLQESHEIGQLLPQIDNQPVVAESVSNDTSVTESRDGELDISHVDATLDEVAEKVRVDNQEAAEDEAEKQLAQQKIDDEQAEPKTQPEPAVVGAINWSPDTEPTFGGTLNATTEQAEEDKRRESESDQNKTTLSHSHLGEAPAAGGGVANINSADIFANNDNNPLTQPLEVKSYPTIEVPADFTLADIDASNRRDAPEQPATDLTDQALSDVHESYALSSAEPVQPSVLLPQPPPLPDFSMLPPPPVAQPYSPAQPETERLGDIFAPDSSVQPPVTPPDQSNDPGQFKIPGQ